MTRVTLGRRPRAEPAQVRLPGSKSLSSRALLLAAAASGRSRLRGLLRCDDTFCAVGLIRRLGAHVRLRHDVAEVVGTGGAWAALDAAAPRLDCGGAGTLARFVPGLLAAARGGGPWQLDGSAQLRARPLAPLLAALGVLGGDITPIGAGRGLPLRIGSRGLAGGEVTVDGRRSSQFVSGVLLAAPLAAAPTRVRLLGPTVQPGYVGMTVHAMAAFGAQVRGAVDRGTLEVAPGGYRGGAYAIAADASTAGYFWALAGLTGTTVAVGPLADDGLQPDLGLLDLLVRMGCRVDWSGEWVQVTGPVQLRGGLTVDLAAMSDQLPTVAVLAAAADAPLRLTGAGHVRGHESDRLAAMAANLTAVGARCEGLDDGLVVRPGRLRGAAVRAFGDHRVAMAMAILGARIGDVVIDDPRCVGKTCPDFFARLQRLGVPVEAA